MPFCLEKSYDFLLEPSDLQGLTKCKEVFLQVSLFLELLEMKL